MKTTYLKKEKTLNKKWHIIDASDQILGRLASKVAMILMGKHRADYTPHIAGEDAVIVTNAAKIRVTGSNKPKQKVYKRFSYYPGGLNLTTLEEMLAKKPEYVIRHAVSGMLPKNRLRDARLKKLRIYKDEAHKHGAQSPKQITV